MTVLDSWEILEDGTLAVTLTVNGYRYSGMLKPEAKTEEQRLRDEVEKLRKRVDQLERQPGARSYVPVELSDVQCCGAGCCVHYNDERDAQREFG